MQHFFVVVFTFIASVIMASESITEPLRGLFSIGFEETHLKWAAKTNGETLLSQTFDHLNFLALGAELGTIQRNFLFNAKLSYGMLGRGALTQETPLFILDANTEGSTILPSLEIGYFIHLTPDHYRKIRLIPKLGYSGSFFSYKLKTINSPFQKFQSGSYQSLLIKTLKQTWYGFFLGGDLQILLQDGFKIDAEYFYHFDNLSHDFQSKYQSLNQLNFINYSTSVKTHHGFSHDASLKFSYALSRDLFLGALMSYRYFFASKNPIDVKTQIDLSSSETASNFHAHHELFQVMFSTDWNF